MELSWFGQAAFKLKGKSVTVVTDPFDPAFTGLKWPKTEADIVTVSHSHEDHNFTDGVENPGYVATGPGEYEIKGVSFTGTGSFHDTKGGSERGRNIIFTFNLDDVKLCHLGDLGQDELTDTQLEEIGDVDVLLVPVGGTYTISASGAAKVTSQLEPKIVIPMHYLVGGLKFPLDPVENFIKEMGKEAVTPTKKLIVTKDKLPEEAQVVILERS